MITPNGSCVGSCSDFHYSGSFFFTLLAVCAIIGVVYYIFLKLYPIDEAE